MNTIDPFDLLQELEKRTLKRSAGLPMLDEVQEEWVGVGFRIGDSKLIASMSDVKEILDMPEFTLVPGVKSWIVGVANVRGSLLPIMDMKGFLLGDDIKKRHNGRVIVIDYMGFDTGLIVEEIYGAAGGCRVIPEDTVADVGIRVPLGIEAAAGAVGI